MTLGFTDPIPAFNDDGNLPPGIHVVKLEHVVRRFGGSMSLRRSQLTKSLRDFYNFAKYYAIEIYIDGSYITEKVSPSDVDLLIILPADFPRNIPAYFRLMEFVSNNKGNKLHVFPYLIGAQDDEIDRLREWFSHDRNRNQKGIIKLETKND